MTDYDVSTFTKQEKQDWIHYAIIPGPVHNNFDVCDKSCYVATFEHAYRNTKTRKTTIDLVDLYVVTYSNGNQTVLYRKDSEWEGSYGSMPLESFLQPSKDVLQTQAFQILVYKGKFTWQHNSKTERKEDETLLS